MADLEKSKQALASYNGTESSLNDFIAVAVEELGDNWSETIYENLTGLAQEEQEKLDHAFQYYAATTAWNEAQSYLSSSEPIDPKVLEERIPVLEHWLTFFQEAGLKVVEDLRQKLVAEVSEQPSSEYENTAPIDETEKVETPQEQEVEKASSEKVKEAVKKPWLVEKIQKEIDMTKAAQAWIAARCIALGNKEVFAYPHYGFMIDLMKQTRTDIQELLDSGDVLVEAEQVCPGEVKSIQDYQISLDKDIEIALANSTSEETDLMQDNLTAEDLKKALGEIDTSNTPEFSGPAPDGFEPILDTDAPLDEQTIKDRYNQIEETVITEQPEKTAEATEEQKKASQTPKNGVKKKLSFSLGNKKPAGNK